MMDPKLFEDNFSLIVDQTAFELKVEDYATLETSVPQDSMCNYWRKFCGKHQSATAALTIAQIADFEKHFQSHSCGKANIKKKGGQLHEGQQDIALGNQHNGALQEELCSDTRAQ